MPDYPSSIPLAPELASMQASHDRAVQRLEIAFHQMSFELHRRLADAEAANTDLRNAAERTRAGLEARLDRAEAQLATKEQDA